MHIHVAEVDPPRAWKVSVIVSTVQVKLRIRLRNLLEITGYEWAG